MDRPPTVRADIVQWSHQIDRLTLEADHGRLVLRSTHPLVLTAVQRHRTLGAFITRQLDAVTVELRPDAYPELLQTFDACRYPVMDHVPTGWQPAAAVSGDHPGRAALQEPGTARLQVLPGAYAVVPAGKVRALLRVGGGLHLHLKQRFEGAIDPGQSQV